MTTDPNGMCDMSPEAVARRDAILGMVEEVGSKEALKRLGITRPEVQATDLDAEATTYAWAIARAAEKAWQSGELDDAMEFDGDSPTVGHLADLLFEARPKGWFGAAG